MEMKLLQKGEIKYDEAEKKLMWPEHRLAY